MRPQAVERFEMLYIVSLALGLVTSALTWKAATVMASPAFVLIVQGGTLALIAGLVLLVSRRSSNIARWVLLILFVVGVFFYIPTAGQLISDSVVVGLISAVQIALQAIAMVSIFSQSAKPWFAKSPKGTAA
jgi:hypothetical protein